MEAGNLRAQEHDRPARPPPPRTADNTATSTVYDRLKQHHEAAFAYIDEALTWDESGSAQQALALYNKASIEVKAGLEINIEEQWDFSEDRKQKAVSIQQRLTKAKLQIESRLDNLRHPQPIVANGSVGLQMDVDDPPPSYEESIASSHVSDMDIGDSILGDDTASLGPIAADAEELFTISDGVQIFFITPEGYVSAPSYPTSLKLCKFMRENELSRQQNRPPAFLQVGSWYYPLVPGVSPALHTSYGGYIFPDTAAQASSPGSSVGLILPDSMPHDERQKLEQLLASMALVGQQEASGEVSYPEVSYPDVSRVAQEVPAEQRTVVQPGREVREQTREEDVEEDRMSTKISKGIVVAAEWISWGVEKGAEKAGQLLNKGSVNLRQKINPKEKPTVIPDKAQKGAEYARFATHCAVRVSGFIITKLGDATMALGRQVAPHIRKTGEKVLPRSWSQKSANGYSTLDAVVEVAASGLKGFGTVYLSLEAGAKALAKNIASETVSVVNHKYGEDAGQFTNNALYATGNVAMAGYNVNHLGVKAIAKRAAKDTGKAVLEDLNTKRDEQKKLKLSDAASVSEKPGLPGDKGGGDGATGGAGRVT